MKTHTFKNLSLTALLCFGYVLTNAQTDNTYLMVMEAGVTQAEKNELLLDYNSTEIWESPYSNVLFCEFNSFPFPHPTSGDPINDINEGVEALEDEPKVKTSGPDHGVSKGPNLPSNPNDACFSNTDLKAASSNSVIVSILDTGLSVEEDNSDNTYKYGYFTGYDYIDNDPIPEDTHGHGTHIAGIISHVSQHLEPYGIEVNISFDIRKVFDSEGEGNLSKIIYAFDEAVLAGAGVVNCSFAFYGDATAETSPFKHAIDLAKEDEVLVIASASNESHDNDEPVAAFPASFDSDNILSVASHNCEDKISDFSNFGIASVDIAALGENIIGPSYTGGTTYKSGTSQAAAITSGTAVMLTTYLEIYNYAAVKCAIMEGVDFTNNLIDKVLTSGTLNIHQALDELENCGGIIGDGNNGDPNGRSINNKIEISPNPFNDEIKVNMNLNYDEEVELSVYNIFGQKIGVNISQTKDGFILSLPKLLASGNYFLKIEHRGHFEIKKLVKS